MAFISSQKSRLFHGPLAVSGYARDVMTQVQVNMLEVTTLADTAKAFIIGQDENTLSFNMLFDDATTATSQYTALLTNAKAATSVVPFSLHIAGTATGSEAWLVGANDTALTINSAVGGTVDFACAAQGTGPTDIGVVVEDLTAITTDTTGTARDLTAASTNGGVAHLHVTAFSGLTSNAITIEHSVDGSTSWATLGTFTTVTGVTAQRLEIAGGTTVRRYLRVVDDVTGTGSCTRIVSFARR